MRKRIREDWLIRVYKYSARPIGDLPQELWDQAKAMNRLWNALVEVRELALIEIADLYKQEKDAEERGAADEIADYKRQRAERWKLLDKELRDKTAGREFKSICGWEAREAILDRFRTAAREAIKRGGTLKPKRGPLDYISIPHRFTAGGVDVASIFNNRGSRINIIPLDGDVYADQSWQRRLARETPGTFGVGVDSKTLIRYRVVLHRPLPPESVVKSVRWCGVKHPTRGWVWTLQFTLELPPGKQEDNGCLREIKPAAGLDLGWRKFQDYLRIGVLYTTAGQSIELRLPLTNTSNKSMRRLNAWISRVGGEGAKMLPTTLEDIWALQRQSDERLDAVKETIRSCGLKPEMLVEDVQGILTHLVKVRAGGLVRLMRSLDPVANGGNGNGAHNPAQKARMALDGWFEEHERARAMINDTRDRLLRRRRSLYENIGVWLRDTFNYIVWEDKLDLKQMASEAATASLDSDDAALKLGAKYRQWASISELRSIIVRGANDGWLVKGVAGWTTVECDVCGASCEPTSRLIVICPEGHKQDQDVRAARNLLNQLSSDAIVDKGKNRVAIPAHLANVIVPL